MKKLLLIALVILALVCFYIYNGKSRVKDGADTTNPVSAANPDPSNATFYFDDETVTLSSGKALLEIEGSSFSEEVTLTSDRAYGDINGDKKNDAAVILARLGGGSGMFIYVAGFVSGTSYKGTDAIYLGDRIKPQSVSISGGVITVSYLDRKPSEPFAAEPTVSTTAKFVYKSGELQAL